MENKIGRYTVTQCKIDENMLDVYAIFGKYHLTVMYNTDKELSIGNVTFFVSCINDNDILFTDEEGDVYDISSFAYPDDFFDNVKKHNILTDEEISGVVSLLRTELEKPHCKKITVDKVTGEVTYNNYYDMNKCERLFDEHRAFITYRCDTIISVGETLEDAKAMLSREIDRQLNEENKRLNNIMKGIDALNNAKKEIM